jgi:hypothetical protein
MRIPSSMEPDIEIQDDLDHMSRPGSRALTFNDRMLRLRQGREAA